jgi:hypothetical protein
MKSGSPSAPRTIAAGMLFLLALACASIFAPGHANAAAAIAWQVENPFRFFTDPSDTEVHRATYRALGPEERATPVLSQERALQSRQEYGWAATMYRKTCWSDNRFKCDAYDDYINPTSHAVFAEITGVDDAAALTCTWLTAPRNSEPPRGDAVTQPCSERARFVVPYPTGMTISVEIGGLEVAKADVKVRDILIAGMGDSFASGEGNPDVAVKFSRERSSDYSTTGIYSDLDGYPARIGPWRNIGDKQFIKENARWLDQACHRSLYSEQMRTALQLAIEDPHRAVTFVGVSCAGAEVTDGLFLRYKGNEWVPNPPRFSQISAVAEAQCGSNKTDPLDLPEAYHINGQIPELKGGLVLRKCPIEAARKIDLVLLSIGGNDIGFSRLLANAVLSNDSLLRELGGWFGEVHGEAEASAELGRLSARYKSLNRALHNILYMPWEQSDRILLVAYPGLALEGDGSLTCSDGKAGMEVVPDFQLSGSKVRLGVWFADKLHRLMRNSAEEFGWTFVETHRRAFIGRGICAGVSVAGVSQVDELRLPRKIDGAWKPYNPADFQPYASRQRWFRTPNDAFMTANFHVAAGFITKVLKIEPFAPFQLVLAATYSGAFHPTAEGEAAIADAVVSKARAVLAKYGDGPDVDPATANTSSFDENPPPPVAEPDRQIPDVKSVLTVPHDAMSPAVSPLAPAADQAPAPSQPAAEASRQTPPSPNSVLTVPHDAASPPVSPLAPAAEPAAATASQPPAQSGRQAPDAKSALTVPHNDGDVSVSPLAPVAGQTSEPSPQVAQPPPDGDDNEVVLPFAPATGQASEPSKSEVR